MLEKLFSRATRIDPRRILLSCLLSFVKHGQEEISLPQILDGVSHLQKSIALGYEFSPGFLYSPNLFTDIARLEEEGYIRQYEYAHDGFLPKSYVSLTMLGRGTAEREAKRLSQPVVTMIDEGVERAIAQHKEYWRLYARL
jgi:DNA-binding PadR family transcriptional regulator